MQFKKIKRALTDDGNWVNYEYVEVRTCHRCHSGLYSREMEDSDTLNVPPDLTYKLKPAT